MGYDVTLHSVGKDDLSQIADLMENADHLDAFCAKYNISGERRGLLADTLQKQAEIDPNSGFNRGPGFALAAIAGIIRPYFYVRGSAFTALTEAGDLVDFTTPWAELLPRQIGAAQGTSWFDGNYSVGGYISHENLLRLREGLNGGDADLASQVNAMFSHDRIKVLKEAMDFAIEAGTGLLEATDLIVPQAGNDTFSETYTYVGNNRGPGIDLYVAAAQEQMRATLAHLGENPDQVLGTQKFMGPVEAVKTVFQKYVTFTGRARRAEYWWFVLFYYVAGLVMVLVDNALFEDPILTGILVIACFLPTLAVSIRRLHDTNRSGWWVLISLVPIVGSLVLLVFFVLKGTKGRNDFGDDPLSSVKISYEVHRG